MAISIKKPSFDFSGIQTKLESQFKGLNPNDPASWPIVPKALLCIFVLGGVVVLLWFLWLSNFDVELESAQAKEVSLKTEYKKKLVQAINLDGLKEQRRQVQQYVTQIEKQLPSKSEMDALLSDINKARSDRGLQLDLFKPGSVSVKEYYAELPIDIKVTGKYSQLGEFAADIAQLSRIVTLNSIAIVPSGSGPAAAAGTLSMTAVAKTFRYLDLEEVSAQRKTTQGAKKP